MPLFNREVLTNLVCTAILWSQEEERESMNRISVLREKKRNFLRFKEKEYYELLDNIKKIPYSKNREVAMKILEENWKKIFTSSSLGEMEKNISIYEETAKSIKVISMTYFLSVSKVLK